VFFNRTRFYLGYSQAATTHRYAHLDADPLRRAVDTIGATITAAMEGNKGGSLQRFKSESIGEAFR
jgi:hypothetical protein